MPRPALICALAWAGAEAAPCAFSALNFSNTVKDNLGTSAGPWVWFVDGSNGTSFLQVADNRDPIDSLVQTLRNLTTEMERAAEDIEDPDRYQAAQHFWEKVKLVAPHGEHPGYPSASHRCQAGHNLSVGDKCVFNKTGYVCENVTCTASGWTGDGFGLDRDNAGRSDVIGETQHRVACTRIPSSSSESEYGGAAVALVVTPAVIVLAALGIIRLREARLAAA